MDRFRKEYSVPTPAQKEFVTRIKDKAQELEALYMEVQQYNNATAVSDSSKSEYGRHISIALTELESSAMWAVKSATTDLSK